MKDRTIREFTMIYQWKGGRVPGINYLEVDHVAKEFTIGYTASYPGYGGRDYIKVEIKRLNDINHIAKDLAEYHGYKFIRSNEEFMRSNE